MQDTDNNEQSYLGANRRDFVKAVGAAGLVGGVGASSGMAVAQEDDDGQGGELLVFAYDFYPGATFSVDVTLQQSVTVDILDGPEDDGIPEIDNPSDYSGYVIHYDLEGSPVYSFVFSRSSLETGSTYTISEDQASYFSTDLNLVQSAAEGGGGGGQTDDDGGEDTVTDDDSGAGNETNDTAN